LRADEAAIIATNACLFFLIFVAIFEVAYAIGKEAGWRGKNDSPPKINVMSAINLIFTGVGIGIVLGVAVLCAVSYMLGDEARWMSLELLRWSRSRAPTQHAIGIEICVAANLSIYAPSWRKSGRGCFIPHQRAAAVWQNACRDHRMRARREHPYGGGGYNSEQLSVLLNKTKHFDQEAPRWFVPCRLRDILRALFAFIWPQSLRKLGKVRQKSH
jgi:hypothetical protein